RATSRRRTIFASELDDASLSSDHRRSRRVYAALDHRLRRQLGSERRDGLPGTHASINLFLTGCESTWGFFRQFCCEPEALILPFHVKRLTGGEPELPFQIADTVLRNVRKNSPPTMLRVRIGTVLFSGQWISAFRLQAEIISMADDYCNRLKSAFG